MKALAVAALLAATIVQSRAQDALPADFVYLRDVDASIVQDIRYAGADNFIGRPLDGYAAAECILRREAALALKRVQADLAASALALKVYDCYRPERAVRDMVRWARDGRDGGASKRFHPRLEKRALLYGYISAHSLHATGIAVDVTLVEASRAPAAPFNPVVDYAACTGPASQRSPDDSVDMGTGYDCFDRMSHTRSMAVSPEQRRRRMLLVAAMAKHGFRNYHREWWHFSYSGARPGPPRDVPVRPRAK